MLIAEFGSLPAVLAAPPADQARVLVDNPRAIGHLGDIRAAMLHALREEAFTGPIFSDAKALHDYLIADMGYAREETFRILYLNAANLLLRDELIHGSVRGAPVYPREIMRRALELGATALILVHNHPSGELQPSRNDINTTANLTVAARVFDIEIHDHVVITRTGWTSFRALGLM